MSWISLLLPLILAQDPAPADLVVYGRLFTADQERPTAEALAVRGERIVLVGDRTDVQALVGEETRVIEAGERTVVPGFNDAHTHFTVAFGMEPDIDLNSAANLEEIQAILRAWVEANPKVKAAQGMNWDLADFPGEDYPTKEMLDEVVGDRAVVLWSDGPHGVWCSSKALERAGIDRNFEAGPAQIVLRDEDGDPTGTILGRGLFFLFRFLPFPGLGSLRTGIREGLSEANSLGLTSVQEPVQSMLVPFLAHLHDEGELTVRFNIWGSLIRSPDGAAATHEKVAAKYARGHMITFGALKGGVDGMPGLRTASLLKPYSDDASTSGLITQDRDTLFEDLTKANKAGLAVALHATGDGGVRLALDAIEGVPADQRRRNRIEHAFLVHRDDVPRFAELDVVASVQPGFLCTELAKDRYYARRFGAERERDVLPLRALIDAGCVIALGTDTNLTPIDPMVGLYGAVARRPLPGVTGNRASYGAGLSLEEAIRAYTYGSAYAQGAEGEKGRLMEGMLADIVVLSTDVFAISIDELPEVRADLTVVGRAVVFER